MSREANELTALRNSVAWQEHELRAALSSLGHSARQSLDPGYWVRAHPLSFLFGALALGALLGARHDDD